MCSCLSILATPLFERLCANGATALGPAALLAIAMASRHPGSKVGLAVKSYQILSTL